jgi:hypothetical protein
MLGNSRVTSQLVACRIVLSSIELVSLKCNTFAVMCFTCKKYIPRANYGCEHLFTEFQSTFPLSASIFIRDLENVNYLFL